MNRTIVAVFDSREDAEAARQELIDVGIPRDDVHLRGRSPATTADDSAGFWRRALGATDAGQDSYGHYAEAERRGNNVLVIEDVEEREAASIETALASHGVLDIDKLAEGWRSRGWRGYDENAPALSPADLEEERRHSAASGGAARKDGQRCVRVYSVVVARARPSGSRPTA